MSTKRQMHLPQQTRQVSRIWGWQVRGTEHEVVSLYTASDGVVQVFVNSFDLEYYIGS